MLLCCQRYLGRTEEVSAVGVWVLQDLENCGLCSILSLIAHSLHTHCQALCWGKEYRRNSQVLPHIGATCSLTEEADVHQPHQ